MGTICMPSLVACCEAAAPLAVALLVVVLALVGVLLALGQHRVDHARELVGGILSIGRTHNGEAQLSALSTLSAPSRSADVER